MNWGKLCYNILMFIVGLFSWWYGAGWERCIASVREGLLNIYDYFSLDLLLKTLFSPFRQISAGVVRGPLGVQLQAFIDKTISRIIGASIRTLVLVIGIVTLLVAMLVGALRIVMWPFVPALPLLFLSFLIVGWVPWMI